MLNNFSFKGKIRFIIALCIIGCAVFACFAYYYYTTTPGYALKMVREAIETHDEAKFNEYVDVDNLLEDTTGDIIDGLMGSYQSISGETRAAVMPLVEMFRSPLKASLKEAIMNYVKHGDFYSDNDMLGYSAIIQKAGLRGIEFRSLGKAEMQSDGTAKFDVVIFSPEADDEFKVEFVLAKGENGRYKITETRNFSDFIVFVLEARERKLAEFVAKTKEIIARHDDVIKNADKELIEIMHSGSLGNDRIRNDMREIMKNEVLPDYEARKAEFAALDVPDVARSYYNLLVKICDYRINYANEYARWLETKDANTIHKANELLRTAQTMESEARMLENKMETKKSAEGQQ